MLKTAYKEIGKLVLECAEYFNVPSLIVSRKEFNLVFSFYEINKTLGTPVIRISVIVIAYAEETAALM